MSRMKKWLSTLSNNQQQVLPFVASAVLIILLFWMGTSIDRGWGSWAASAPALLVIVITALARLKDMTDTGFISFLRRNGFILSGCAAVGLLTAPLLGYSNSFPSWRAVFFFWGYALVLFTSPNQPPWNKYIDGSMKIKKGLKP